MLEVERNLSLFLIDLKKVTPEILIDSLTPTFKKSLVYVPKKTLALMHSGYLEVRERGTVIQAELGYGRGGIPHYAVYVHEATWIPHQAPTRSKYLQAAIEEDIDAIAKRVVKGYQKKTGMK